MADLGIKKYRQPYINLPPINSETEGYSLRYRVISEDRNRVSHWSPIYLIVPEYTYVPGSIEFNSANQISAFTWDPVAILKNKTTVSNITNKQLTNDLATLTTNAAHFMVVDDWVTIENVDSTFNGTYKINAVTANTFTYYKDHGNIASTPISPAGTYKTNSFITNALTYDIWLRWDRGDSGDWIYKERIQTTSVSYPHASFYTINGVVQSQTPNRLSIEIYLTSQPTTRSDGAAGTPFLKVYRLINETI
jgi:hypothetical protein